MSDSVLHGRVLAESASWQQRAEAAENALAEAHRYAGSLAESLAKGYPAVDGWQLLPDLYGRLMQIDNMTAGNRDKLAEARKDTERLDKAQSLGIAINGHHYGGKFDLSDVRQAIDRHAALSPPEPAKPEAPYLTVHENGMVTADTNRLVYESLAEPEASKCSICGGPADHNWTCGGIGRAQ